MRVRSLFLSDLHLGCRFSRAEELFQFLGRVEPDRLYLVGDIIDGWKLKRSFYWNDTSSFVVRRMLGMLKRGTRIFYATGNHDEFLRPFAPQTLGGVELADMFIHDTIDGRRLLVIHGDFFDHLTKHAAWVYHLGDRAYTAALHLNKWMNLARRSLGYPYWSFSSLLKTKVKRAVNFINDFEHFVARYTKKKDCAGVVCGHIHVPAIRQIDGVDYYNCGDWMEHCTALVEHVDGRFELVNHTWLEGQPAICDRDAEADTLVEPALAALVATGFGPLSEPRVSLRPAPGQFSPSSPIGADQVQRGEVCAKAAVVAGEQR